MALPGGVWGSILEGFLTEAIQELKPEDQDTVGQEVRVELGRLRGASGQDIACVKERENTSVRGVVRTQYDGRRDEGREEGRFTLMRGKNVGVLRVGTNIHADAVYVLGMLMNKTDKLLLSWSVNVSWGGRDIYKQMNE